LQNKSVKFWQSLWIALLVKAFSCPQPGALMVTHFGRGTVREKPDFIRRTRMRAAISTFLSLWIYFYNGLRHSNILLDKSALLKIRECRWLGWS
jgi:hypothetical protein